MCHLLEFLVSELQAAHIIKHKESHPEETTAEEESEKEQRVEDHSYEIAEICQTYECNDERRKAEMQAEWILVLHSLDMDASSQFPDVLSEVRFINKSKSWLQTEKHLKAHFNAGGVQTCSYSVQ